MYLIGESLEGEGTELAHIDLMIGDKNGPIGSAFANGLSQLSAGHTPLLAVVRPNLLTKPATLIIPKVTLKKGSQVNAIFGAVQAAVAKAIADSVEEGVFDDVDIEDTVILASVYLHPDAADYNRIYRYNYGATKQAIERAFAQFPSKEVLMKEKRPRRTCSYGIQSAAPLEPAIPAGGHGPCRHEIRRTRADPGSGKRPRAY